MSDDKISIQIAAETGGLDAAAARLKGAIGALTAAFDQVAGSVERMEASILSLGATVSGVASQIEAQAGATTASAQALAGSASAADLATSSVVTAGAAFADAGGAAEGMAAAVEATAASSIATAGPLAAQINATLGIDRAAKSASMSAAVFNAALAGGGTRSAVAGVTGGFKNLTVSLAESEKGFVTFAATGAGLVKQFGTSAEAIAEVNRQLMFGQISLREATPLVERIKGAFAATTPEAQAAASALTNIGLTAGQAANGARALFDELAGGRSRQAVGTFSRLLITIAQVNPALAGIVIGVITLTAAIYEGVKGAEDLDAAFRGVKVALEAGGQSADISRQQFGGLIKWLSSLHGISTSTAGAMVQDFAHARGATMADITDMSKAVADFAAVLKEKPAAAARQLVTIWDGPARAIQQFGYLVSTNTIGATQDLLDLGHKADAARTFINGLRDSTQGMAEQALTPMQRAATDAANALKGLGGAAYDGAGGSDDLAAALGRLTTALEYLYPVAAVIGRAIKDVFLAFDALWQMIMYVSSGIMVPIDAAAAGIVALAKALWAAAHGNFSDAEAIAKGIPAAMEKGWAAGFEKMSGHLKSLGGDLKGIFLDPLPLWPTAPKPPTGTAKGKSKTPVQQDLADAIQMNATEHEIDALRAKIKAWRKDKDDATDPGTVKEFADAIANAQKKIDSLSHKGGAGGTGRVQQWRGELERIKASSSMARQDDLAADMLYWQRKKALTAAGSKERLAVEHEEYAAYRGLERQVYQERIADYAEKIAAAKSDWAKREALMRQEADYIKTMRGAESVQYKTMLREIERAQKEHYQQAGRVIEQSIEAEKQASLAKTDLAREQLTFDRQMGATSAAEEHARAVKIANERYAIERKALEDKWSLWDQDPVKRAAIDRQLEALDRKYQLEIKKIDDKAALDAKHRWQSILQPIQSAFSSSIQGIIQGTQTLKQAMANAAQSIVLAFANKGVELAVDWAARMLGMTAATTAGKAAQTGVVVAGEAAQTGVVAGGEAARTGAVVAGETARTAAKTAGAAAGLAISGASAIKEIAIDAYKAAAGAYSAIASIPYIGPFLAPVVAAGALAAVFKFGSSIASAEGGYDIPAGVNPVTQLHQNEMVLPAPLADRVRKMTAGGGGGGDVHLHVQAVDAKSVERLFRENGQALARVLKGQHRNFVGGMA